MEQIVKDVTTIEHGVIAHGVNCQGVMNSGVARAIRSKWPEVYDTYSRLEPSRALLGTAQIVLADQQNDIHIANCFTQETYGHTGVHAEPAAIATSLTAVCHWAAMREADINTPIYMPQIGCGLGGLSWNNTVLPIVMKVSKQWPELDIYVCSMV